jgi:hypothetical protein
VAIAIAALGAVAAGLLLGRRREPASEVIPEAEPAAA